MTYAKKKCFISFDYDNDKTLKEFLVGQSKNDDSPFEISDGSIKEASHDWKDKAKLRIMKSDVVIVLCGKNTDTATGVSAELEMAQDTKTPYFLLACYSDGGNKRPKAAKTTDKVCKWTWNNLKSLIHGNR